MDTPRTAPAVTFTVQPPSVAQINVTPADGEKVACVAHEYEPAAKVTVAPSLAELRTVCTSEIDAPEGQDHVRPLPVHAARAVEISKNHARKLAKKRLIRRPKSEVPADRA